MPDLYLDQLESGRPLKLEKDGKTICVTRIGHEVFAIDDTCSHSEASLSEGEIVDFKIQCWLHGAEFDLRTGEAVTLPANIALATYPVKIQANLVTVEI
ncbi:MAG: non-heme iron oxygenase ferredoxin subunit [Candidatus Planktophila sp.]|nr:non-heme iron oxygenase ferredoxin subunit [Candidatus Planktophila sp.]